jgi:hypothetical protein
MPNLQTAAIVAAAIVAAAIIAKPADHAQPGRYRPLVGMMILDTTTGATFQSQPYTDGTSGWVRYNRPVE